MSYFAKDPVNIIVKRVPETTCYEDIKTWLESKDKIASALRHSVGVENCVAFIQIGGFDSVLCCAPHPSNPQQCLHRVRPLKKSRGVCGTAIMMLYK